MTHEFWTDFWITQGRKSLDQNKQLQVLRTENKTPIDEERWQKTVKNIVTTIDLQSNDTVLDLCCGNGLISTLLAKSCKSVTCVDISSDLLSQINVVQFPNIKTKSCDIREFDARPKTFDKIIFYAGIQYLNQKETIKIFQKMFKLLKENGKLVIGDIPDINNLWVFFNTKERESNHFESVINDRPIVGTWFEQDWLSKLAIFIGFSKVRIIKQPDYMIYSHYRFDMEIIK